ncbi:MAG: hypothetical protein ABEJ59_02540 [Halanaeroarchaeum sp.]
MDEGVLGIVKRAARSAGRQVESARREFSRARREAAIPADEEGRAKIVCRRHAERRAVHIEDGAPECYEADHPACESCVADLADGVIETW